MRRVHLLAIIIGCILMFGIALPLSQSQAADSSWRGEYFANRNLSGTPAAVRQDKVITFNWGLEAPIGGVPSDHFSVRWTRRDYFNAGPYDFAVSSDDGSRMYLDGVLIINNWHNQEWGNWKVVTRQMTAGEHTVVVEYYDATGIARIQAGHEPKNKPTPVNTATRTPTKGPSPTPTITRTPRPTRTPSIAGTVGVRPTAFRPPPTLVPTMIPGGSGVTVTETPGPNRAISEADPKLFTWKGFPGPAIYQGGQGGSYYYVKSRNNKPNFEAMWNFSPGQSGYYDVYVFIPASARATQSAIYQVFHGGQLSPGIVIDQTAQPDQWVFIGNFYFTGGQAGQFVYLSNQTSEETASRDVLVDAVMLIYVP